MKHKQANEPVTPIQHPLLMSETTIMRNTTKMPVKYDLSL